VLGGFTRVEHSCYRYGKTKKGKGKTKKEKKKKNEKKPRKTRRGGNCPLLPRLFSAVLFLSHLSTINIGGDKIGRYKGKGRKNSWGDL
jgi:hypothetical protein